MKVHVQISQFPSKRKNTLQFTKWMIYYKGNKMTKAGHGVVATPRSPMQEGRLLHSDLRAQAPLYLFPREKVKGLCVLCIAVWGFRPAPLLSSWRGGLWGSERSDPQGGLVKAVHTRRDPLVSIWERPPFLPLEQQTKVYKTGRNYHERGKETGRKDRRSRLG